MNCTLQLNTPVKFFNAISPAGPHEVDVLFVCRNLHHGCADSVVKMSLFNFGFSRKHGKCCSGSDNDDNTTEMQSVSTTSEQADMSGTCSGGTSSDSPAIGSQKARGDAPETSTTGGKSWGTTKIAQFHLHSK